MEKKQPDTILQDGYEVFINTRVFNRYEYDSLFDPQKTKEEADKILGKIIGKPDTYIHDLCMNDYQLLITALVKRVNQPPDPNFPSASISPS